MTTTKHYVIPGCYMLCISWILITALLISDVDGTCSDPGLPTDGYLMSGTFPANVDDEAEFACDFGYLLLGNSTLVCLADGSWSSDLPNCTDLFTTSVPGLTRSTIVIPTLGPFTTTEVETYTVPTEQTTVAEDVSAAQQTDSKKSGVPALETFLYCVAGVSGGIIATYVTVVAVKAYLKRRVSPPANPQPSSPPQERRPPPRNPRVAWGASGGLFGNLSTINEASGAGAPLMQGNLRAGSAGMRSGRYSSASVTATRERIEFLEGDFFMDPPPGESSV